MTFDLTGIPELSTVIFWPTRLNKILKMVRSQIGLMKLANVYPTYSNKGQEQLNG